VDEDDGFWAVVTAEESDDELVAQVAKGDGLAFARLVQRHRSRLMAVAARILGSAAMAEDIVQETFTRAWINAPRWRVQNEGRAAFAAWLSRIATNLSIDQLRRANTVPLEAAPVIEDDAPGADAQMIEAERTRRLHAAMHALPARQRAAIALTYDDGYSNAEGASILQISTGAFELLLVRARRALRLALMDGNEK
jgi:RNA polymerase sigma-70 factor (ECF subfamily)